MKKQRYSPPHVRIVRCPRCSERLPEPSHVPLYICGGCGATLESKYYNQEQERKKSIIPDNSSNALDHAHRQPGGESSGSSPHSTFSAQHSPDTYGELRTNSSLGQHQRDVPNSDREASSSSTDPCCNAATKFPSPHSVIEDGKTGEKQQCAEQRSVGTRLVASIAEAGSLENHHDLSDSAFLDLESMGSGEQPAGKEVGLGSCTREETTQVEAPAALDQSDVNTLSSGEVEQEKDQHVTVNQRSVQISVDGFERGESSLDGSCVFVTSDKSLPSATTEDQKVKGANHGHKVIPSKESVLQQHEEILSGLPQENQVRGNGLLIKGVIPDNDPFLSQNKNMAQTPKETRVGKVGHGQPMDSKIEKFDKNPQTVTSFSNMVNSNEKDESPCEAPGDKNTIEDDKDQHRNLDWAREHLTGTELFPKAATPTDPDGDAKEAVSQSPEANALTGEIHSLPPPQLENEKLDLGDVAEVPMCANKLSAGYAEEASGPKIEVSGQKNIPNGVDNVISVEEGECLELANAKLDALGSSKVSHQSASGISLACTDGNFSSYGNDDQNLSLSDDILGQTSEVEDPVDAEEERHDSFPTITPEHYIKNCHSSDQQSMSNSMLNNVGLSEGVRYDSGFQRNRMRPRTEDGLLSGYSLYSRNLDMAYESSASSYPRHDEFHHHSNFHRPPHSYMETRDKRRHRYRSDVERSMLSDSGWLGEGASVHPCSRSSGEIYPNQSYYRYQYPGVREETQLPHSSAAHIPYSGELMRSGYLQMHDPYLRFYPASEMRWSLQFSPPGSYCHPGRNTLRHQKPFDSFTASSQFYAAESDSCSWDYEAFYDDQRNQDQMMMNRLHLMRNKQSYIRPMAGGAPFLTCYECSELLELPSDFLIFTSKKIHRLKCTTCSSILKFRLEKGNHLVPYSPKDMATSTEAVEGAYTRSLHLGSASHKTYHNTSDVPLSTSAASPSQSQDAAEGPSCDSLGPQETPNSKLLQVQDSKNRGKRAVEELGVSVSSVNGVPRQMKVTWKEPPRSTSMGYSSPSQVIHGRGTRNLETLEGLTE